MSGSSVNLTFDGMDTVISSIQTLTPTLQKKVMKVLGEAAKNTLAYSQAAAPVDTGAMEASGRIEQPDDLTYLVSYGDDSGDFEYPWYVELGTVNMDSQPFLGPAFEGEADTALDDLIDIMYD